MGTNINEISDEIFGEQTARLELSDEEIIERGFARAREDSILRERRYADNLDKLRAVKRTSFLLGALSFAMTGGVWICMTAYYIFRSFLLGYGASMVVAEIVISKVMGEEFESPYMYEFPVFWLCYFFIMAVLVIFAVPLKVRAVCKTLGVIFSCTSLYGAVAIVIGSEYLAFAVTLIVYGLFGVWLVSKILNQLDDLYALSKEEGYPDFIISVGEPRSAANTRGLPAGRRDEGNDAKRKKTNDLGSEKIAPKEPAAEKTPDATSQMMDELDVELVRPFDAHLEKRERPATVGETGKGRVKTGTDDMFLFE
jgi:hypothetical protein